MAAKGMTEKQEAFCVHFVRTGNAAESYRLAYDVAEDARDDWLYVEACQMLDHPKIAPRIEQLREDARKISAYGILDALEELESARTLAHDEKQPGAAVSAVNGKVKLLGLGQPVRVAIGGDKGMGPVQLEAIKADADDFARAISGLAAAAGNGSPAGEVDDGSEG